MQEARGYNPYKIGFVGGSDSHNTGVPYRQNNFFGGHGVNDGDDRSSAWRATSSPASTCGSRIPAGLTGIWAEENTRASLFDAMQRKETFATSGPRIKVRFFGGWDYAADVARRGRTGSRQPMPGGVPMGGDLPPLGGQGAVVRRLGGEGPDLGQSRPHPDRQGLDQERPELREGLRRRLGRRPQARPRSPARCPPIGSTVDIAEATLHQHRRRGGAEDGRGPTRTSIRASHAFYYARVLEIPTPRWTTIQAKRARHRAARQRCRRPCRSAPGPRRSGTRRPPEARKAAPPGMTVADLKQKGATALDDAAAEGAGRRQVDLGAQQRHRRSLQHRMDARPASG